MSAGDPADAAVRGLTALAESALSLWPGGWRDPALIKHRENAVFAVTDADGRRAVLRVHRHGYHDDVALHSELTWMAALREAGVATPQVIGCRSGEPFARVRHAAVAEARQVDLLSWLPGAPLGSVDSLADLPVEELVRDYRRLGELAARTHGQAVAWAPPAGFRRHAWDQAGLIGAEPLWGRFWELPALTEAQRALLDRARTRAAGDLDALGTGADIYSLIHADLVPENVMADGDSLALIDFDDAGYGWHLFELATALFFFSELPAFPAIRDALFAGYEGVRPGRADPALLPLFLFLRSTTYLGWVQTRQASDDGTSAVLVDLAVRAAERYLAT